MFQVDFDAQGYGKKVRVVVVETRKELQQVLQSVAFISGDKAFYKPSKDVHAVTVYPFGQTIIVLSRQDLTWEAITHEATHVAHSFAGDDNEDVATHVGQLTSAIAKELKTHGYKIIL